MTSAGLPTEIPRIALTSREAAASLGVSPNFFSEQIAPDIRSIRLRGKTLYPVEELAQWARDNAAPVLRDAA